MKRARYPSLRDRAVFITGGGSGIGAALVVAFCRQGARVGFVDIADAPSRALVERLSDANGYTTPVFHRADVRDIAALQAAIESTAAQLGPIRVLINNAAWDHRHRLDALTPDLWDEVQAINLRPHVFTAQAVAPMMAAAKGGSIINLSSNSYLLGLTGYPGYIAAKAAITGLSKSLARELGPRGIRVNAVLPGWVMTQRQRELWVTPEALAETLAAQCIPREIMPEDVARLVLFLAADDSRMITGQAHVIDGGRA